MFNSDLFLRENEKGFEKFESKEYYPKPLTPIFTIGIFVRRKLARLRKFADREISRVNNWQKADDSLFSTSQSLTISKAGEKLKKAMEGDDKKALAKELKTYKATVDQFVPFYKTSLVREYGEAIIIALILALIIRTFVIQAFRIPSSSMVPTLLIGDQIVVNKFLYGTRIPFTDIKVLPIRQPRKGDIIVFKYPEDPKMDFIKRVVGVPGDQIRAYNGHLWVNGELIDKKPLGTFRYYDKNYGISFTNDMYMEALPTGEDGEVKMHRMLLDSNPYDPGFIRGEEKNAKYCVKETCTVPEGHYLCMGDNRDKSNDGRAWGFVDEKLIKGKAMVIYFSWPPKQLIRFGKILK